MNRRWLLLAMLFGVATGCSNNQSNQQNELQNLRSINLVDRTDAVLLAGTSAGKVRDFLELGLKSRGYSVCSGCTADADVILTVEEFKTGGKYMHLTHVYRQSSTSVWFMQVEKNGVVLFDESERDEEGSPIDELAARQVQDILDLLQGK